ncbi:MAG: type II secretion system protein [Chthoniobacteraceae bacterium]|nr:type II secretion system protein [Chthoniobacteraceae bacterium]
MIPSRCPGPHAAWSAFTLVEVVVALGIFSFALVAIVGLFFVGINTNKESSDQIQAANLASLLISTRRALPASPIADFALPPLTAATSGSGTYVMGVAADGMVSGGTVARTPSYNLFYKVSTNTVNGAHLAQVYLMLWWPPVSATPTNNPANRYELTTQVALP